MLEGHPDLRTAATAGDDQEAQIRQESGLWSGNVGLQTPLHSQHTCHQVPNQSNSYFFPICTGLDGLKLPCNMAKPRTSTNSPTTSLSCCLYTPPRDWDRAGVGPLFSLGVICPYAALLIALMKIHHGLTVSKYHTMNA